jgi:hypothetical protein
VFPSNTVDEGYVYGLKHLIAVLRSILDSWVLLQSVKERANHHGELQALAEHLYCSVKNLYCESAFYLSLYFW